MSRYEGESISLRRGRAAYRFVFHSNAVWLSLSFVARA